jgi:hypothetical protein
MGGGGGGGGGGVSAQGALINHGASLDARGVSSGGRGGADGGGGSGFSSSRGAGSSNSSRLGGGSSGNGGGAFGGGAASSYEAGAFNKATYGVDPGVASQLASSATSGDQLDLTNVDTRYVPGAYSNNELVALVGEQIAQNILKGQGHIVFADWTKAVSATGFDLVTLAPDGTLWIIDNKAQFRGIGGANALTGTAYDSYVANLRSYLTTKHPIKWEADAALAALNQGKVAKVVTNGFAGEATRFTAGLFEKGLIAYDIRVAALFFDYTAWRAAFDALSAQRVLRKLVRGTGVMGVNILAFAAVAELGYMIASGQDMRQVALGTAVQIGIDTLLSKLPGGFFASFALTLESDNPQFIADQKLTTTANDILNRLPGVSQMSEGEKDVAVDELKNILKEPMQLPEPTRQEEPHPKNLAPGLPNPLYRIEA